VLTLALQFVNVGLTLGFAVLILLISQRSSWASSARRHSCWLVGVAFAINGISGLVQRILAVWAFVAGPESPVYTGYLQAAPAMNQSRTGLEIALTLLLAWIAVRGERPLAWWLLLPGLIAGGAAGTVIGLLEGTLVASRHFSMVALLEGLEMVALLAMLLLALIRNSMDRFLWLALATYAVQQSFNAIWTSALAWENMPGGWAPRPWMFPAQMALLGCVMLAIALRRYQLARRGVHVPSLLEPLMAKQVSSFH